MAGIVGVSFGTPCDHTVRRTIVVQWDETTERFFTFIPHLVDAEFTYAICYVNDTAYEVEILIDEVNPHKVWIVSGVGGFGWDGFGVGPYGYGLSIPQFGQYPLDDIELEFRTIPLQCAKCDLKDESGQAVPTTFGGGN